ncbi:MAG TPA: SDR family oxidoreductase [Steroidobacteraceae bacterium]|nr:SDR family oxidoreductase [Steroidobacteraceae bacterium]
MDLGLQGRRALVLGSSSGLGKAIAARLAAEGARVVVAGRDETRLKQTLEDVGAAGMMAGDLTCEGEAVRIVETSARALDGLDILVVNTGGGAPGGLGASSSTSRQNAYMSMLRPALDAALAAAPWLRAAGSGRLLFVAARTVVEASTELALSSVFRSGIVAAARSLALELAPDVLVNVIVPGRFDTPAYHRFRSFLAKKDGSTEQEISERHLAGVPLGRLGRAEELADTAAFLCSQRAAYITGTLIRVDGGATAGFGS